VRVFNTRNVADHLVEPSRANPRFLNVVIRLPGIIGALPMARYVVEMLGRAGLDLAAKKGFDPFRKAMPKVREAGAEGISELVSGDARYGSVVCLCETVTEGEIADAVHRGAITMEGVKFRTRATMGRCQGNFCRARIEKLLEERVKSGG
jgi:glycerol-3-phosphate dehydrogenase